MDICSTKGTENKTIRIDQGIGEGEAYIATFYHILIETPDPNLSAGIRQLNGGYTQSVNRCHGTGGHILQGRFKSILVKKENHLLELCRYIVLNPVRAGMTLSPDAWQWSSYRATAGLVSNPDFLSTDWILARFSPSGKKAKNLYTQFVLSGITKESPWKDLKAGIFLGPASFVDDIKDFIRGASPEIPKRQRQPARPELTTVIPQPDKAIDEQLLLASRHLLSSFVSNYSSRILAPTGRVEIAYLLGEIKGIIKKFW